MNYHDQADDHDDKMRSGRLKIARAIEYAEAHGEALKAKGWTSEEVVREIFRRAMLNGARPFTPDSGDLSGQECWDMDAIVAASAELARVGRMSIHLARACPCAKGVEVRDEATGERLTFAIVRTAMCSRPWDEWKSPTLAQELPGVPADARLRCAKCGAAGPVTHVVVMRDAIPRGWLSCSEPDMFTRERGS